MPDRQDKVRANVRHLAERKGWSLATVWRRADIGRSTLHNFLAGTTDAGELVLYKLAGLFEVSVEDLQTMDFAVTDKPKLTSDDEAGREIAQILRGVSHDKKADVIRIFRDIAITTAASGVAQSATEANRPKPTRASSVDTGA